MARSIVDQFLLSHEVVDLFGKGRVTWAALLFLRRNHEVGRLGREQVVTIVGLHQLSISGLISSVNH